MSKILCRGIIISVETQGGRTFIGDIHRFRSFKLHSKSHLEGLDARVKLSIYTNLLLVLLVELLQLIQKNTLLCTSASFILQKLKCLKEE